jgi:hypothetical protein
VYTYQNKLPLRQFLYLGLPVGLTKHLCSGTSIACRRMCKGDDLEDGLLVPNLSISHLTPELEKQEFLVRQSDKKLKKKER